MNTNTAISRQLMRTARTLQAEWRQVLRGSVSTGAKEDELSTGRLRAAEFRHVGPFSFDTRFEIYEPFIFFNFHIFSGRDKPRIMNQWIWGHDCTLLRKMISIEIGILL
jgi:hypothetical protein